MVKYGATNAVPHSAARAFSVGGEERQYRRLRPRVRHAHPAVACVGEVALAPVAARRVDACRTRGCSRSSVAAEQVIPHGMACGGGSGLRSMGGTRQSTRSHSLAQSSRPRTHSLMSTSQLAPSYLRQRQGQHAGQAACTGQQALPQSASCTPARPPSCRHLVAAPGGAVRDGGEHGCQQRFVGGAGERVDLQAARRLLKGGDDAEGRVGGQDAKAPRGVERPPHRSGALRGWVLAGG